jgi:hypothetical protein
VIIFRDLLDINNTYSKAYSGSYRTSIKPIQKHLQGVTGHQRNLFNKIFRELLEINKTY